MIEKKLFDVNAQQGITRTWHYNTDTDEVTIQTQQDVTDVIEANKAIYNAVDEKANWTGEWHLVASIPESLYYKMKNLQYTMMDQMETCLKKIFAFMVHLGNLNFLIGHLIYLVTVKK